ncbi:MAG: hypothetical protein HY735_29070, partial [Verrucomicrobia bacterium]|nr:hypothetical protein [Verrucomicrobiota bacterium]
VRGLASGPGGNYGAVQGDVLAQHSGGQLVLSPLDENSDQPISASLSVSPTNEFRAVLGESFGVFAPPATNSGLTLITRALVAGQERDLPSLHFDYAGAGWKLTARRDRAPLLLGRVQVWNNGTLLADLTNAPNVQLSALPPVHWPTLVRTTDDDISHRFPCPSGVDVLANGVAYAGTELRVTTDTYGEPVQALTGERVEAVRVEVLALPPLEAGPAQYRLEVPELGSNEVTIRWSGIGGVLESTSSLSGPWVPVPGSESSEITLPIERAQAQFFRVRSQ